MTSLGQPLAANMIRLESIAWRAGAFGLDAISFTVPAGSYGVLMGATFVGQHDNTAARPCLVTGSVSFATGPRSRPGLDALGGSWPHPDELERRDEASSSPPPHHPAAAGSR